MNALKLNEASALTPKVDCLGAWADGLRKAACEAVKPEDMAEVMAGVVTRAKSGDAKAVELLLKMIAAAPVPVQVGPSAVVMVNAVASHSGVKKRCVACEGRFPIEQMDEKQRCSFCSKAAKR